MDLSSPARKSAHGVYAALKLTKALRSGFNKVYPPAL
jgi:hypothetical protein